MNVNVAEAAPAPVVRDRRDTAQLLAVGLIAGAIIALQIGIMRIYAVGSWAHFGSLVVSLAMFGFSASAVVVYIGRNWFERHWTIAAGASMALFGPLLVAANLVAQQLPFNAIFLVSDPNQKWRLIANFALYFLPFFSGALFLGTLFLKRQKTFGRLYFADLTGSGIAGLLVLAAMYVLPPETITLAPLALWAIATLLWFGSAASRRALAGAAALVVVAFAAAMVVPNVLGITTLAVNSYKGISYARNFPDAERIYRNVSPFGDVQIYASSYMHFAPGLSDNAAFNLPEVPANAYVGMYIDGDGPEGIMRNLAPSETAYFRFLPMYYPYVIKQAPKVFVVQFGGGISTNVALRSGATHVTVAESNPAVLAAFDDPRIRAFTGDILHDPRIDVVPYEGRLALSGRAGSVRRRRPQPRRLGRPVEPRRLRHRREVRLHARGAGHLHARAEAGRHPVGDAVEQGGAGEVDPALLRDDGGRGPHRRRRRCGRRLLRLLDLPVDDDRPLQARRLHARRGRQAPRALGVDVVRRGLFAGLRLRPEDGRHRRRRLPRVDLRLRHRRRWTAPLATARRRAPTDREVTSDTLPATTIGRLAWNTLIHGGWNDLADRYVFDIHPLSNDRPYFAAYVKPADLAARDRPAERAPGRLGLPAHLGDARRRQRSRRWC